MGNYICCTKKDVDSPHHYHYSPKLSPKIKKSPKLKCKRCKHCDIKFFKYSPQIFCSNECRLMKNNKFLTEDVI
jgi:late competence protein required for DNA uptake (superfamily II DNA/RNA helicase)